LLQPGYAVFSQHRLCPTIIPCRVPKIFQQPAYHFLSKILLSVL
jgi:hypothetical protein